MAVQGILRDDCGFQAVQGHLTRPRRAPHFHNGKKMLEDHPALDTTRSRAGKLRIEIRWERFQAQPKWEIPASVIANPLSGGVLSIQVSWPARPKPGRFSGVQ